MCWMSASIAHAAPLLRVRAASHFAELHATPQADDRLELQGTLQDDLNQPIANAIVTLPATLAPRGCDESSVITTDHQGKFCAHVDNRGTPTRVVFAGDSLLTETSAVVETRAMEPPPTTVVVDTPNEWLRSAAQQVVNLTVNTQQELVASVTLYREGQMLATLPKAVFSGGSAVVEVPGTSLPAAGPISIRADVLTPHGTTVTTAEVGIDIISTIQLSLRDPSVTETRTGSDLLLRFEVTGDPPAVGSGWVELQADGANVAMAPVVDGKAEMQIALTAARQRNAQLRAVFVPQFQFHTPGQPLAWTITVLGPRQWLHIPLAALLIGFTWRLVRMWRRPARESARATSEVLAGAARVVRHEPSTPIDGWQGTVMDAHTGLPIAGATVSLIVPALVSAPPARESITRADGTFRFDKLTPLPEGSRLVVQAVHHSNLEYPAPRPGVLEIALVARRRTLLAALREWANWGASSLPDPTPLELAHHAQLNGDNQSAQWIRLVDEAVYGHAPVLGTTEADLLGHRPARVQSSAKGR